MSSRMGLWFVCVFIVSINILSLRDRRIISARDNEMNPVRDYIFIEKNQPTLK
jgi:hypothetical protein